MSMPLGKRVLPDEYCRYIDAKYTTRFTYTTRKFQRRGPATAANVEHMLPDTGVYLTKRGDTRRP